MSSLGEMTGTASARFGDAVAMSIGDSQISFKQLNHMVERLSGAFQAIGLKPGDRVAILLLTTPDFVTAYFAAHRAGLVVMPLNPLLGPAELGHILGVMRPKLIISGDPGMPLPAFAALAGLIREHSPDTRLVISDVSEEHAKGVHPSAMSLTTFRDLGGEAHAPIIRRPEDEAIIMFSSGTSGEPKGISISEGMVLSNRDMSAETMRYTADDVILSGLPFSHVFGQVVIMLAGLMSGATLRLAPRPAPDLLYADLQAVKPTFFVGVPTTIAALAELGRRDPTTAREGARNLRLVATGGSGMPRATGEAFAQVYGHQVLQGYGMTEVCGCIAVADLDGPVGEDVGTVWPIYDWKIEPTDPERDTRGELFIRGPNVMRGYYINGALQPRQPDDWFATGDVVEAAGDGRITIVDRKKEMIIRGGYNVYPSEVEAVLTSHPDVALAAVVGVPHDELGEEIAAFVTLGSDTTVKPDALKQWVRDRIALYKYPRHVIVLDEMPTNPTGKILKKALPLDTLVNPTGDAFPEAAKAAGPSTSKGLWRRIFGPKLR